MSGVSMFEKSPNVLGKITEYEKQKREQLRKQKLESAKEYAALRKSLAGKFKSVEDKKHIAGTTDKDEFRNANRAAADLALR